MVESVSSYVSKRKEARDDLFWKHLLYFFELKFSTDGSHETTKSMLFPLVMAPQAYTMGDPFSVAVKPVLGGGIYVEENGILARPIRIQGTTGFEPRLWPQVEQLRQADQEANVGTYSFPLRGQPAANVSLSGQRQFQMLQDRIFRLYGDLKRNPLTSSTTRLFWHNLKDEEHWRVIPQNFSMIRDVSRRMSYTYDIQMLAVEQADAKPISLAPEDIGWLQKALAALQNLRDGLARIVGAIENTVRLAKDIANAVSAVGVFLQDVAGAIATTVEGLFSAVAGIVNACQAFLSGVVAAINAFPAFVNSVINGVEAIADAVSSFYTTAASMDDDIEAAYNSVGENLREMISGLFGVMVGGADNFTAPATPRRPAPPSNREAAAQDPVYDLTGLGKKGTAPNRGDARISRGNRIFDETVTAAPAGSRSQTVAANQSIEDIAQSAFGDSSRWQEIARLNNLRAPYIHPAGLPGTLRPGDPILVPVSALSPVTAALPVILGAGASTPTMERLLGNDLALAPSGSTGVYDLQLAPTGSTDVAIVRGIDNLKQAIGTRVRTTRGDSGLFSQLGTDIVIGTGTPGIDRHMAKVRVQQGIQADPRITNVTGITLNSAVSADIVDVEFNATVYGLSEKITISTVRDD